MSIRTVRIFSLLLISLLVVACTSRPDYVVDEETMTNLLTDVHLSEGLLDVQTKQMRERPEYGQDVMAAVLHKYGISKEQYDTSLVWYSQNLKFLIRIYNHVGQNLENLEKEWLALANDEEHFGLVLEGDSVNVWPLTTGVVLDEARRTLSRVWRVESDSCYRAGDSIRWQMHLHGQPEGQCVVASLILLRNGGNLVSWQQIQGKSTGPVSTDTLIELSCGAPDNVEIDRIQATLHVLRLDHQDENQAHVAPVLVDSIRMIRLHKR